MLFYNYEKSQKALKIKELLACFFDSNCNCNSHTNHGVVTSSDKSHHLFALGVLEGLQSGEAF